MKQGYLRAAMAAAGAGVLALAVTGCASQEERLAKWNANYKDICASTQPGHKLYLNNAAMGRIEKTKALLQRTATGQQAAQSFFAGNTVYCYAGQKLSGPSQHDYSTGATFLDASLSDEALAVKLLADRVQASVRTEDTNAADYRPGSALAFHRVLEAHKKVVAAQLVYETAGGTTSSPVWSAYESSAEGRDAAAAFRGELEKGEPPVKAQKAAFDAALGQVLTAGNSTAFLKWYGDKLKITEDREEVACKDDFGNVVTQDANGEPVKCYDTYAVLPPDGLASKALTAGDLEELSNSLIGSSDDAYLNRQAALEILRKESLVTVRQRDESTAARAAEEKFSKCCGDRYNPRRNLGGFDLTIRNLGL